MDTSEQRFSARRQRLRPGVIALLVLAHLAALYGLTRVFAPQVTDTIERSVVEAFTVTVTTPLEDPPAEPDEGAAGAAGKEAVPKPVTAPTPRITPKPDQALPQAASTGSAATSGARDSGEGTGASGAGHGTGSGGEGSGQGSGAATGPVKIAGTIRSARDYPVPEGGREVRFGTAVRIALLVGTDGLPRRCRDIAPTLRKKSLTCRRCSKAARSARCAWQARRECGRAGRNRSSGASGAGRCPDPHRYAAWDR